MSSVSLAGYWFRVFAWSWLLFVSIKLLGMMRRRSHEKEEMQARYLREAELEREYTYAKL